MKVSGTASVHAPLPICGGVAGGRPFSVAPLSSQFVSVMKSSELTMMMAPPACWTWISSVLPSYWNGSWFGPTALISSSG